MISLPKDGFRSRNKYVAENVELMCDWLEASVLFKGEAISSTDIVDVLEENAFYKSQDDAWIFVEDLKSAVAARRDVLGEGYPISIVDNQRYEPRGTPQEFSSYAFCLILSLIPHFKAWKAHFGQDYTEQGELFEDLTAESVRLTLVGWEAEKTGWSRSQTVRLPEVVQFCAESLGETVGDIALWVTGDEKEAGLDLLCYRRFPDQRVGYPTYLFQCASGMNWTEKRKTPDLELWTKIIPFASRPKKGFAMPFAITEDEFRRSTNLVDGLLFDRIRLLLPGTNNREWLSDDLSARVVEWCNARLACMPLLEDQV